MPNYRLMTPETDTVSDIGSWGIKIMGFHSILFNKTEDVIIKETPTPPEFFVDLNIDQIVDAVTAGRQEYNLKPFFYTLLHDTDSIKYRHEIMIDMENTGLSGVIKKFAQQMRNMYEHFERMKKLYYQYQKERWLLESVEFYCNAVTGLLQDMSCIELKSRGFLSFRDYLSKYITSDQFTKLYEETNKLKDDLATVKYCLHLKGTTIRVRKYESEVNYSEEVNKTFEKFKQGSVKDYSAQFTSRLDMNHIEAKILDMVGQLFPDIFLSLDRYYNNHINFIDDCIAVFDREIQFYAAYLEYIEVFKRKNLKFCYPEIAEDKTKLYSYENFDLALAGKLRNQGMNIVCNDYYLEGCERIFVVSGPNQGGKTTFARTFGQLHYLSAIGCPVPGRAARLFMFDKLFTHFEKEESITTLRGKLQDDLIRIYNILAKATPDSIIIMNEIFTSTTLKDAIFLSKKILEKIMELDLLSVCVTFLDELSSLSSKTVSMVSTVVPDNPTVRTYKIERKPADGLSYAISIAEKYRLSYEALKERLEI